MSLLKKYFGTESRKPPAVPTDARPGSAAKIDILHRRVIAGESLWHKDDKELKWTTESEIFDISVCGRNTRTE